MKDMKTWNETTHEATRSRSREPSFMFGVALCDARGGFFLFFGLHPIQRVIGNTESMSLLARSLASRPNVIYFLRVLALKCTMRPQTAKESKKLSHKGAFDAC